MLVKGKVEMKLKKYSDAMKTLESAMDLPGVRDPNDNVVRKTSLFLNLSIEDRASIYINLALAYAELDRM